jgi:uncharacterized protein YbjT (DUF2867 family)
MNTIDKNRILLTGASGYVGGRLLLALEARGEKLRCLTRRPDELRARVAASTEVCAGDVLRSETLAEAMQGVDVAYYMVHSMGAESDFSEQDRLAAENFARAAEKAGVRRIIYLGGLGEDDVESAHLRSRHEVGRILRASQVEVLELRASIIIGSGSLSFEMIRSLVNKLPVMVTPRWVYSLAQPISIEDVIAYLMEALDVELADSEIVEIGGVSQVGYLDIMTEYARQRGMRRLIIPLPVLSTWLSSLWLGLVTPLYARVGRKLIDSVRHDTLVHSSRAQELFSVHPMSLSEAIARALANEDSAFAQTRWCDALSSAIEEKNWGGVKFGSRLVDSRSQQLSCAAGAAFAPIERIGGDKGWYYGNGLWRLRGFVDLLLGGPGLRRGRRDPQHVLPGDALDFWRVEQVEPGHLLRLRAEMKLPGRAWLQFEVEEGDGGCVVRQTALFDPVGLAGLLYWDGIYPLHALIFRGMFRGIIRAIDEDLKKDRR